MNDSILYVEVAQQHHHRQQQQQQQHAPHSYQDKSENRKTAHGIWRHSTKKVIDLRDCYYNQKNGAKEPNDLGDPLCSKKSGTRQTGERDGFTLTNKEVK